MKNVRCIELTKDNYKTYLDKVQNLEEKVSNIMIQEGRVGQFFTTGKEGIEEYILSTQNSVMVAIDEDDKIISATYITQGQAPFTYNDITKYFKYGKKYQEYVKMSYESEKKYKKDLLTIYEIKLKAYEYAKKKVMEKCTHFKGDIMDYLQSELKEEDNKFHEKSELREGLNIYMFEYIKNLSKEDRSVLDLYDKFYWITASDIAEEFKKDYNLKSDNILEYEALVQSQRSQEYTEILSKGPLKVLEKPKFDVSCYAGANTQNSVEIDTYITDPSARQSGVARIIVYEGIKKHIKNHFKNEENKEIYLCSTLHRDNNSSKYVSEFFGLFDNLYVQRRNGRNREVHICRISRDEYTKYLQNIEDKLIVLYGYNPNNKQVSDNKALDIIKEQLKYEEAEVSRLKVTSSGNYRGSFNGIQSKIEKINSLKEKARTLRGIINRQMQATVGGR